MLALLLGLVAFARTAQGWFRWAGGPAFYPRLEAAARERFVAGAHAAHLRQLLEAIPPEAGMIWAADELSDRDWLAIYALRPRPARLLSPAALRDQAVRERLAREGWRFAVADLTPYTLPELAPALPQPPVHGVAFPAGNVSARGWLALLLTAAAAYGLGLAIVRLLLPRAGPPVPATGRAGLALVTGLGALGALVFLAALLGGAGSILLHGGLVAIGVGAGLLALREWGGRWPAKGPRDAVATAPPPSDPLGDLLSPRWRPRLVGLLLAVILLTLLVPVARAVSEPMHHWDERFQWAFKAKLLVEEGGIAGPTFAGRDRPHLHRHYPLLVPGLEAQVATLAGGFAQERAVKGLFPLFLAGLALTAHGLFRLRLGPATAAACTLLLTALPPLHDATRLQGGPAHTGFADLPLAAFIGAAAFVIAARPDALAMAGLFAGLAALCKPEGIVMLFAVPLAVALATPPAGSGARVGSARLRDAGLALAIAAAVLLPRLLLGWLVPAAGTAGYTGDEDYLSRLGLERILAGFAENAGTALPALLGAPFTPRWAWLGTLPVLVWLLIPGRARSLPLLPLLVLPLAADFLAYILTGSSIAWHLAVSLDRLWIHLLVPVLGIFATQLGSNRS